MKRGRESEALSRTRQNIERKRKALRHRRRLRFLRFCVFLVCLGIFCVVAGAIGLRIYSWGSEIYGVYAARHEAYLSKQAAHAVDPRFDGYTNVLLLGVDDAAVDAGGANAPAADGTPLKHADTILLLSLANDTGKLRVIQVPRDTWVDIPGTAYSNRMATLYGTGGAPLMVQAVEKLLGVSVHQYIVLDTRTLADLIDALGGLDLYVESKMDYEDAEAGLSIHLAQGYQHLTGEQAAGFLRYRGTDLGDVGRTERQQQFVKALYAAVMQASTLPRLPRLAEILQQQVETSAEIFDAAHLANVLRHLSSEPPAIWRVPGTTAEHDDTIWVPDTQGITTGINELFPEQGAADTEE